MSGSLLLSLRWCALAGKKLTKDKAGTVILGPEVTQAHFKNTLHEYCPCLSVAKYHAAAWLLH